MVREPLTAAAREHLLSVVDMNGSLEPAAREAAKGFVSDLFAFTETLNAESLAQGWVDRHEPGALYATLALVAHRLGPRSTLFWCRCAPRDERGVYLEWAFTALVPAVERRGILPAWHRLLEEAGGATGRSLRTSSAARHREPETPWWQLDDPHRREQFFTAVRDFCRATAGPAAV